MKKIATKTISTIVTVVLLILSVLGIPAYAISGSCVSHHFMSLTTETDEDGNVVVIPTPPSEMSCAYAAMSMLLTFYDSYWDNNFVDDHYEWQNGLYNSSTDSLIRTFSAIEEAEAWQNFVNNNVPSSENGYDYYKSYALSNSNNFFEPYLVSIGTRLKSYNESDPYLGLTAGNVVEILEIYLYEERGFKADELSVRIALYEEGDDIYSVMTEQISKGFPAIYLGQTITGEGHALIAYNTGSNHNIMFHTGWSGLETIYTYNNNPFGYNGIVIWLEINEENLPHTCSNNYFDVATNTPMCSCKIYSSHSAHDPDYYHEIEYNNIESHCYKCDCGYVFNVQSHNLTYSYYNPTQHYEDCADCAYMGAKTHSYTTVMASTSASGHQAACVCGQTTTEEHYVWDYVSQGRDSHAIYCECGYLIGTEYHDMEPGFKLGTSCCAICGYIRDNSGFGEAIMGTEDENSTQ